MQDEWFAFQSLVHAMWACLARQHHTLLLFKLFYLIKAEDKPNIPGNIGHIPTHHIAPCMSSL